MILAKLRERKGFLSIEAIVWLILILYAFVFAVDILQVGLKWYHLNKLTREGIRSMAIYGGFNDYNAAPVSARIDAVGSKQGFAPYGILMATSELEPPVRSSFYGRLEQVDYGNPVYLKLGTRHDWLVSKILPVSIKTSDFFIEARAVSERKFR